VYGESTSAVGVHWQKVCRSLVVCETKYVLGFIKSKDLNEDVNVLLLSYVVGLHICSCLYHLTLPVTVNHLGQKRISFICGFNITGFHV